MTNHASGSRRASSGPLFPTFLLPSLSIPFRRRRTFSFSSSSSPPDPSPVPSLSSSPHSSDAASPTSPSPTAFSAHHGWANAQPPKAAPVTIDGRRLSRSHPDTLRCGTCSADIAFGSQIVSKGFTGRHGRAYLVSSPAATASHLAVASPKTSHHDYHHHPADRAGEDLANIRVGRPENRQLVTGAHVVADITCVVCGSRLGWKYVDALEASQQYKIGKFILETQRVVACRHWEDVEPEAGVDAASGDRSFGPSGYGAAYEKSAADRRASGLGEDIEGILEDEDEDDAVVVFDSEDEEECEDIFNGLWDPVVVAKRRKGKVFNLRKRDGPREA